VTDIALKRRSHYQSCNVNSTRTRQSNLTVKYPMSVVDREITVAYSPLICATHASLYSGVWNKVPKVSRFMLRLGYKQ